MRVHNGCSRTLYHDGPATHWTHESQPGSCEVACHALSLSIFHLPTTAAIGPEWDLRCLHGYASLKRRTVLFAAWHLVRLGWELGRNFPGFCIGSGASRSAGLAAGPLTVYQRPLDLPASDLDHGIRR